MSEQQSELAVRGRSIWPEAVIAFGLSAVGIWIGLLAFGLFKLIVYAI